MIRTTTLLAISLMVAGCTSTTTTEREPVTTGFLFESVEAQGRSYDYAVYVPRAYNPDAPNPMILFLHGRGESGDDGSRQIAVGLPRIMLWDQQDWPFVVVMPQKPRDDEWEDHAQAIGVMLRKTMDEHRIDKDRVYLTGLSQGGHGTWTINAAFSDTFAAIAPVCGYGVWQKDDPDGRTWVNDPGHPTNVAIIRSASAVPTWAFHGLADGVVPAEQTRLLVDAIREAGGDAKMTLYEGVGHNAWDRAYGSEGLGDWLLSHRKTR